MLFRSCEKGIFIVDCTLNNSEEVLEIVKLLKEESFSEWIEPVLMNNVETCNYYYGFQYYLKNTGQYGGTEGMDINVEPAWQIVEGSSDVTVAIIDMGVDFDHIDMSNCVLNGYTVDDPSSLGRPKNANNLDKKWHGVGCAGIVGAEDNSTGIKGVAYGTRILPVNIAPDSAFNYTNEAGVNTINEGFSNSAKIAQAIRWAYQRADILSCSWKSVPCQLIEDAVNEARLYGRDGKGSIVVASSGNYFHEDSLDVAFPACIDGVIAVGALDMRSEEQHV